MTESNVPSKDETNRDKVLRGEAVKVSDGRLAEMRTQAIRNEGISVEAVYHWHWAAAMNELTEARAAIKQLRGRMDHGTRQVAAIITWLEANQPDVFKRGLWDAIPKDPSLAHETGVKHE